MRRFWTTKPLQMLFPNVIWRTDSEGVHLTFDDGPDPIATPVVLAFLAKHSFKATFFLLGAHVARHPELAKRISEEGHSLGIHSYDHMRLAFRSRRVIHDQLERARNAVHSAARQEPHLFRPPYGFLEPSLLKHVSQRGYTTVMWDVDPGDSLEQNPDLIVKRVASSVRLGSIILLHDNANTRGRIGSVLEDVLRCLQTQSLQVLPLEL